MSTPRRGAFERAEVHLRGHHLVCLQFYLGEGYSAEFTQNLARVVTSATEEPAVIVQGADDICAVCPGLAPDGTCLDPKAGELEVRRLDRLAWELLGVKPGSRISLAEAREKLAADAIATGRWRFEACSGCTWEDLCERGWNRMVGDAEALSRQGDDPPE